MPYRAISLGLTVLLLPWGSIYLYVFILSVYRCIYIYLSLLIDLVACCLPIHIYLFINLAMVLAKDLRFVTFLLYSFRHLILEGAPEACMNEVIARWQWWLNGIPFIPVAAAPFLFCVFSRCCWCVSLALLLSFIRSPTV